LKGTNPNSVSISPVVEEKILSASSDGKKPLQLKKNNLNNK